MTTAVAEETQAIAETRDMLSGIASKLRCPDMEVSEEVVVDDDPAKAIIEASRRQDSDFVAMTTHGRSGLSRVVHGSVASAVVRSGEVPVFSVRPK